MSELSLRPCPFCGTSLEVKWFNSFPAGFGAECKSPCSFGVYGFDTKKECIKFVNTRPIEDGLRAELARRDDVIKRLKEDGERLAGMDCQCDEHWAYIILEKDDDAHSIDCPITLHRQLMKEVE